MDWFNKCEEDEVKFLHFDEGLQAWRMKISSALLTYTSRAIVNRGIMAGERERLSGAQSRNFRRTIGSMPPQNGNTDKFKNIYISICDGSKITNLQYDKNDYPYEIRRLYDIGGGYLEETISDEFQ